MEHTQLSSCLFAVDGNQKVYARANAELVTSNLSRSRRKLDGLSVANDDDLVALGHLVEELGGEFDGHANAAMGRRAPAHIASVDGDAVTGKPQRVGHGRIVVSRGPMVLDLRQDGESAGRRFLLIGAVQNHGGPDLVAGAERGQDLRLQIDPHPDGAFWHIAVVPDEIPELHALAHVEDGLDVTVEPVPAPGRPEPW